MQAIKYTRISSVAGYRSDACARIMPKTDNPIEESLNRFGKERGVVARLWNVRVAVPRVVQRVNGKVFRKLRYDFFEQIELRSQRMKKHQDWASAGSDEAQLMAPNINVGDRYVRRPTKLFRRVGCGPEGLNAEGCEPNAESNACKYQERQQKRVHKHSHEAPARAPIA